MSKIDLSTIPRTLIDCLDPSFVSGWHLLSRDKQVHELMKAQEMLALRQGPGGKWCQFVDNELMTLADKEKYYHRQLFGKVLSIKEMTEYLCANRGMTHSQAMELTTPQVIEVLKTACREKEEAAEQPEGKNTLIAPTAAEAPGVPIKWLFGWLEIVTALEMKYADREKIKTLNDRFEGPIVNHGSGTQPMVSHDRLMTWWNGLATKQQDLANQRQGKRLSATASYQYGRGGEASPEIAGSVKKRRRK